MQEVGEVEAIADIFDFDPYQMRGEHYDFVWRINLNERINTIVAGLDCVVLWKLY